MLPASLWCVERLKSAEQNIVKKHENFVLAATTKVEVKGSMKRQVYNSFESSWIILKGKFL